MKFNYFLLYFCLPFHIYSLSYQSIHDGYFTTIHVLVVDPSKEKIKLVRAQGGRETVATLAKRYDATAAINGGFWKQNGDPAGILKVENHWYGLPIKPRGAIGWDERGNVLIDRLITERNGDTIDFLPFTSDPKEWGKMKYIVGGTPVLIQNGKRVEDFSPEQTLISFLKNRHPRTAVGIKLNGEWVFVVVDNFYRIYGGMTMNELAKLMEDLGCVDALNLDGGSSSTMVIDGCVVNHPYGSIEEDDKYVEAVSDAILIFPAILQ